jgi:hypothetical protein
LQWIFRPAIPTFLGTIFIIYAPIVLAMMIKG